MGRVGRVELQGDFALHRRRVKPEKVSTHNGGSVDHEPVLVDGNKRKLTRRPIRGRPKREQRVWRVCQFVTGLLV